MPPPRSGRAAAGLAVALALALALGCGRGGCSAQTPAARGGAEGVSSARGGGGAGGSPGTAGDAAISTSPAHAAARSGRVVRIRDGDSIVVLVGGAQVEVRLHGIDAPELGQAFGRRAKRLAGDLAFGRQVRLEPRGKDDYDRELAEVVLPDGRSLNHELVSAGLAWWYRKYTDDADLASREGEARAARRGLWADRNPVPPWEFRNARRR